MILVSLAMLALATGVTGCAAVGMLGWDTKIGDLGGPCVWESGFGAGTEDVAVDPVTGGVYVSAGIVVAGDRDAPQPRGGLWLLRFGPDGTAVRQEVTGGVPREFHPHGIAIWEDRDRSERRLFVINHQPPSGASRIEIYRILGDGRLEWLQGRAYSELPRPNDLVATGRTAFFAVNDHGSPRSTNPKNPFTAENLETLLPQRKGAVVYVDETGAKIAQSGLAFPAGIAISPELKWLYVGETSARAIGRYERLPDNRLVRRNTFQAGPMPDNLTWSDGRIWYGAHSRLLSFLGHAIWPSSVKSPGRVEIMNPETGARQIVFRQRGAALTTLSVGAPLGDQVVVAPSISLLLVFARWRRREGRTAPLACCCRHGNGHIDASRRRSWRPGQAFVLDFRARTASGARAHDGVAGCVHGNLDLIADRRRNPNPR